jgi:hypothetical protein
MRQGLAVLACLVAVARLGAAGDAEFVVHEWGVNIRSTAAISSSLHRFSKATTVKNILSAPQEMIDDLPGFVLRHDKEYTPRPKARDWNKPVLHLYGPDGLAVKIKVLTPQGTLTAYWPKPELIDHTFWFMGSGITGAVGLEWSGKLVDKPSKPLPEIKDGNWWKTVRGVPGRYFENADGAERFLFYEGIAIQEPFLTAHVTASEITLKNGHKDNSGTIVVITNDGVTRHVISIAPVPGNGSATLPRKTLEDSPGSEDEIVRICHKQWEQCGLTAEESTAVVETWKPDLLHRLGFILISLMPADAYEEMFPLTITPKPDKLVRVGMVFDTLPGENERLGWLPGMRKSLEPLIQELSNDDFDVRRKAEEKMVAKGDILRPLLEELSQSKDAELRERATSVIQQLAPVPLKLPGGAKTLKKEEIERQKPDPDDQP